MTFLFSQPKKSQHLASLVARLLPGQTEQSDPDIQAPPPFGAQGQHELPLHINLLLHSNQGSHSHRDASARRLLDLEAKCAARGENLVDALRDRGLLDEAQFYADAAKYLKLPYIDQLPIDGLRPLSDSYPLSALDQCEYVITKPLAKLPGLAPIPTSYIICAPQGDGINHLQALLDEIPDLQHRLALTHPAALRSAQRSVLSERAFADNVYALRRFLPHLSAHNRLSKVQVSLIVAGLLAIFVLPAFIPLMMVLINLFGVGLFLSIAFLRLFAFFDLPNARKERVRDLHQLTFAQRHLARWPSYNILVPLYKEARIVPDLVAALQRIDYPRQALTIHLIVEEDDQHTREAIEKMALRAPFETIVVPNQGPRTKPKALNYALGFVNSDLTVIFDAEDRPHPNQLREAALRMFAGGDKLACLQGRLSIDNGNASWLARQFALEYSALFDGLLPFLARQSLPVPLGGTSNHFRTHILKKVGGWDPYNVTEDADLGLRLSRLGYRTDTLFSDTQEEAPERYVPWMKQRTRWFKGWMQTWLVQMRAPRQLWSEMGRSGFLAFQILIAGMLISALIHPLYILSFGYSFWMIASSETQATGFWLLLGMNGFNLLAGYGGAMALAYATGKKRHGLGLGSVLMQPLYWLAMTPAAWRALYQLLTDPHKWEKTEHGLAKGRPDLGDKPSA